jgi:hypothetical protein
MGGKLKRLLRRIRGPVLPIGDRLIVCAVCGSATDNEAKQLERDLELCLREIASVVDTLDRERMVREAESFITALRLDLIGPADFAPHLPR